MTQFKLGLSYERGLGIPANFVKAFVWSSMAKTQGHKTAAISIDALTSNDAKADRQALAAKCYASNYKDCD